MRQQVCYLSQLFPEHLFAHHAGRGMVPSCLIHHGELKLRRDQGIKVKLTRVPLGGSPVPPASQQNMYLFSADYDHIPRNPNLKTLMIA
jgi:hypothetical protein